MKLTLMLTIASSSLIAFPSYGASKTEENKSNRDPAAVSTTVRVLKVQGSDTTNPEKWEDEKTGVVCYVAQNSTGAAVAMSCVKVK